MKKILHILLIAAVLVASCIPATSAEQPFDHTVVVNAPAVTTEDGEKVGVISEMEVSVSDGDGSIFVETWPLSELDTQASARLAVSVAERVTGIDATAYNFYYSTVSDAPVIGGPSAGAILTVATIACINGWDVYPDVMMTGMINPDGTVGPVGGIYEKAKAASEFGITLFLVPQGQATVTVGEAQIDLTEYAPSEWGMEVREVLDITEAVTAFTGHEYEQSTAASTLEANTSFYAEAVGDELDSVAAQLADVNEALYDASLRSDIHRDLTSGTASAAQLIEDAQDAIEQSRYYTAMSYLFQARVSLTYAELVLQYYDTEDRQAELAAIVDTADARVTELSTTLDGLTDSIYGYAMLDAYSAAQERLVEAQGHADLARQYLVRADVASALYWSAYAMERTRTGEMWMSLAQQYPCGDSIDIATLKDTADTFIEDANLIVIYASELVGSSELVSGASDKLALAQEEYVAGDYAAALYNAIDARTRAALAIELIGTTTVSEERMDVARSQAAAAINAQVSSGVQPLLSMSYYEFATVFAEEGNTVQATLYYQQAAGLAGAFLYLGADSLSSAPVEQGSSAEQPCGIRASVPIAFGIAGMAIGWVGAAVMGRRKRSRPKDD